MIRHSELPVEFSGLQVDYVQRVSQNEYSSSCPACGGVAHQGGEFPDRFRMFLNAHGKNRVMGWCRRCNYVYFPDSSKPLSSQEMEQWRQEQIRYEEERKRSAERAIELLKSEKLWLQYNAGLNDWAVSVLKSWGIRKDWADYWRLGLYPDYKCYNKQDGEYFTPAITIPIWQQDTPVPANIKLRILNPKRESDRYRSLYKIGTGKPFVAFNKMHSDTCLVVEGEKKAMVSAQWSEQKFQVVGVPTKTPSKDMLQTLDSYGKIFLCLDPDAKKVEANGQSPLRRMVDLLGKERVFVVNLPRKIDDMIVENGLKLHQALRYSKQWR